MTKPSPLVMRSVASSKKLDKAGVLRLADLEKAMQVQADLRRAAHEDGVAAATTFLANSLRR